MIDINQIRKNALDVSLDWLVKSIDQKTGGSRANYSLIFNGLKGWSGPYPETTGYIIPTFLNASRDYERHSGLFQKAQRMADWLLSIQFDDGAFPGNIYYPNKVLEKSIFNTGQIILGLTSMFDFTNDARYLNSARLAANWLVQNQESDGTWKRYNYVEGFSPSYYSRVSWPILKVFSRTNEVRFKEAALKNLQSIQSRQKENAFIDGAGFKPGSYAFLHTLAYTIRGFIESGQLLKDDTVWNTGYIFAERILRKFEVSKELYGAYYPDYSGVRWYQCLTGNAQIAIIWLKIYSKTGDARFLNAASKAMDSVVKHQVKSSWNSNLIGAVSGSYPMYGRYMFMRYPNWAVKFLADSLMLEQQALQKL
jgi:uncharacterized protein YyaL (SSP411 family)